MPNRILGIFTINKKHMKNIYKNLLFSASFLLTNVALFGQGLPCYSTYSSVVTGGPYTSAVADFNKDGFTDVISAPNAAASNVLLRLNDGFGKLNAPIVTNIVSGAGGSIWGITTGDFDNNTYVDYAVSKYASGSGEITLYMNTGGAGTTFTVAASSPLFTGANSITEIKTARLNNDALPDILAGSGTTAFAVLLNTGGGNFAPLTAYNGGGLVGVNVESYDVNNDGNTDVLVSGLQQNSIGLFMGSPAGTFTMAPGFPIATVTYPRQLDYADFNNDGKKDIVVAGQTSNDVGIHLATGTNSFAPAVSYSTGIMMLSAQAGDFNGDGNMDFVAASYTSSYYYVGNGAASFTLAAGYPKTGGTQYWSANKADLNNDGIFEVILSDRTASGKIDVLSKSLPIAISAATSTICVGQSVIATASVSGAGTFSWMPGNLTGSTQTLSPTTSTTYSVNALASPTNTCNYFSKFTISVSPCTEVSEINNTESFNIYPNPSNGILFIDNAEGVAVKIFNSIGVLVNEFKSDSEKANFNLSVLNSGIYFINLSKNNSTKIIKWVKE